MKLIDFKSLRIKLASPEVIKSWSYGEVLKPETINYRTLKPEKDGLFCERIFGPTKDWECYCGKYKRIRYKGVICDKCGVEVTQSKVRRERMGHITLASPVAHIWFFKGPSSKLSLFLDLPPKSVEAIVYFGQYLVTEVNKEEKEKCLVLLEKGLDRDKEEIRKMLSREIEEIKKKQAEEIKNLQLKVENSDQKSLIMQEIKLKNRQKIQNLKDNLSLEIQKKEKNYKVLSDLIKNLKPLSLLTEEEFSQLSSYGVSSFFKAGMGAEVLLEVIKKLDLDKLSVELRKQLAKSKGSRFSKISKRLKLIDGLRRAGIDPSWMIIQILPVIPPDLRPMVQLAGGKFATSDLNDLYRRVINRNNRLKHLISLGAPEIIIRNEKRMLQESVDSLIDSSKKAVRKIGKQAHPLRSLSDLLRGKQGRFRQNLLGKRVDYSGRSVIVVGPELKITQCGLPKEMALEMFRPFVLRELILSGVAQNVKNAKFILEHRSPEVFDILEKITKEHPVLLNRAPTLHKLGIQAFYPILVEGSAIKIHPCVCAGYNADFDGDQMAVHVVLGEKAKEEAKKLMTPKSNLLKPADGLPITVPDKEMGLGCFYITSEDLKIKEFPSIFSSPSEAILAYQTGRVELRQRIKVRINEKITVTTVGRLLFNEIFPSSTDFINEEITQQIVKSLVMKAMQTWDRDKIVDFIDNLKYLGFWGATLSGLSVGIWDCQIYDKKEEVIKEANRQVTQIEENFTKGLITESEKRRLVWDIWIETTEKLAELTWQKFEAENSIHLMVRAKLRRVSKDQVKQLSAMQGLVVDPLGKIVELPIKSNFREGLSVFEYITSARGARKGLTDTALKTSDAGYLTRRLVDAAHDAIIRSEDCQTSSGIKITREGKRGEKFLTRILGRVLAQDVVDPKTKKILLRRNEIITDRNILLLETYNIREVVIRSPLTCEEPWGICSMCYGWDLSSRSIAEVGMPVGIIAAQSIGEPGTQLTLRTKQTGGIVGLDVTQGLPWVEELFEVRTPKVSSPLSEIAGKATIVEEEDGWRVKIKSLDKKNYQEREYFVPSTSKLLVKDGEVIGVGTPLSLGPLDVKSILELKGLQPAREYLLEEIQLVYEGQGISINDKHFEVIIRKMSDKVRIIDSGDTNFLIGEIVNRKKLEEVNRRVEKEGGKPAVGKRVILGLSKTALYTDSWLSSASFEETTNVLTEACLEGKEDRLFGFKENVIVGRLIPVTPERVKIEGED